MEQILPYILKVAIFILTFGISAFFFRGYLRRKKGYGEFTDSEVIFLSGLTAAVITMIVKKGLFRFFF